MTDPRTEAERLIAAVLGRASVAAEGLRGYATGSAECCVCPVCRAIAATRDPDGEFAERLATGAADLASGVAGLLRAFSSASAPRGAGTSEAGSAPDVDPWHYATHADDTDAAPPPPKPMAKKATKPRVVPPQAEPGEGV